MMIQCKECGGDVSDTASACPHCGAPVANIVRDSKSRGVSFILTLLAGPLGLIYANATWGIVLTVIAIATSPTIVGPVVIWFISILAGDSMVHKHNQSLKQQA
jgi:uncharacterized OB-fold protein